MKNPFGRFSMYNTRIAPSPTGDMHIGTARTAYFNWLSARASNGTFMLRIDDTDLTRSTPEFTQVILDTMAWLNLDYDSLVYQSKRFARYQEVADRLLCQNWAKKDGDSVRLNIMGAPGDYFQRLGHYDDIVSGLRELSTLEIAESNGLVLMKSDGSPTYHFASVIDDIDFNINLIIRGVDHISNTPRQVVLSLVLHLAGLTHQMPKYAHIGLISAGGKKLSKRDGAASMLHYRNAGYNPDAMLNFLARLGWGPTVDDKTTKTLPRDRMLELFLTGGKMRSVASNADMNILNSYDRKYKGRIANANKVYGGT